MKHLIPVLLASAIALTPLADMPINIPVHAENVSVKGDVNANGDFNLLDVITFHKWLHHMPAVTLANWKAGDLYEDNKLNIFDFLLMKQLLLQKNASPEPQETSNVYEAEFAALSGNNSIMEDSGASGGKAVGSFAEDNDTITFTIVIPSDGNYCLTFTSKGIGGDKYNEVFVDGNTAGELDSKADIYTDTALHQITFTAGQHTVSIKKSWGWISIDKLTVTEETAEPEQQEFYAVYEAETAILSGSNSVSDDAEASGGKTVGSFGEDTDNVTFTIEVPVSGSYCLTITSKGMGGDKYNEVLVDGDNIGGFDSKGDIYTDTSLRRVMLTAGQHTVSIKKSWGWIFVDKLTVTNDEAISDAVYQVEPMLINPNADANAKALFSYLCESYGKYTLSGQVCNDGLNGAEFKAVYEATGKYPAICGLDMMDYTPCRVAKGAHSNAVETALDFHQHGGIVTFCWHWNAPDKYMKPGDTPEGNPRWWGAFNTSNTDFDIAAVMDGRDPEGKALIDADIAEIAKQLNILRDAGIPVLWRPLHEASGGWFWWGAKGAEAYKKLWYYLYDQLTNKYECTNLIWVWNGQAAEWYPGDDYVDIIGEDIYAGERSYGAQNAKFSELLEYSDRNKIIALTENGTVFDIDNILAANSHWMWFGTWCGGFVETNGQYSETFTERSVMYKTYNSDSVITLDELPWNQ